MFGRRTDDPGGGNRGGNGDDGPPKPQEGTEAPAASEDDDAPVFADGIRVETSRRRAPAPEDAATPAPESPTAPRPAPMPAVPPSAGGAHRAAVYRTAPDPAPPPPEQVTTSAAPEVPTQQGEQAMADGDDSKRLTVGPGIRLKGEISNCDALIVEGNVEADLSACRSISVGESGVFNGTVRVEEATIAGRFEGKLVVSNVLSIKRTGRVRGEVRYGALQVEAGGVLAGSADTNEAGDAEEGAAGSEAPRATFGTRQSPAGDDL